MAKSRSRSKSRSGSKSRRSRKSRSHGSRRRSFCITSAKTISGHVKGKSNLGGYYRSRTPAAAARKAVSRLCRRSRTKGRCTMIVTLQEKTKGGKKKSFTYKGSRIYKPKVVEHAGEKIKHKYVVKVNKH